MLPRKHRLTKQNDIVHTIRRGRTLRTPYVHVHLLNRADHNISRSACIVAKKVHLSAVRRHTYQRWLRVQARTLLPQLTEPCDVVWVAQPQITQLSSSRELQHRLAPYLTHLTSS